MKKAYDRISAKQLVPLLESITREIVERKRAIGIVELELETMGDRESTTSAGMDLKAELATHRRELRLAKKELEKLGCEIDRDSPGCVRIPGTDGDLGRGFCWDASEQTLRRAVSETNAS